jgi:histidine ammonia-lyase
MGMIAARHAREVVANAETVLALEALAGAQALDLRAPLAPGPATHAVHQLIRSKVPVVEYDRELGPDIDATLALVRDGSLVQAAASAAGELE